MLEDKHQDANREREIQTINLGGCRIWTKIPQLIAKMVPKKQQKQMPINETSLGESDQSGMIRRIHALFIVVRIMEDK